MPATEMIVSIAVAGAMVLAFIHLLRLIGTAIMYKTLRKLVDRDPQNAGTLIAQLGRQPERSGDDRLSTILVAVGMAMIAASIVIGDPRWMHYGVAAALFPLIVGTALWLRLFNLARAQRRSERK